MVIHLSDCLRSVCINIQFRDYKALTCEPNLLQLLVLLSSFIRLAELCHILV